MMSFKLFFDPIGSDTMSNFIEPSFKIKISTNFITHKINHTKINSDFESEHYDFNLPIILGLMLKIAIIYFI